MDALTFLDKPPAKRQPVYALFGDEDFLKRRCRDAIIALVVGDADPEFAVASYPGDKLDFSTVRNELETLPFLAPARVVVVEPADVFVTVHRDSLEKYAAVPSKVGVLILDVKSFPETTKLAKALPDAAKLSCKSPAPANQPVTAAINFACPAPGCEPGTSSGVRLDGPTAQCQPDVDHSGVPSAATTSAKYGVS